MRNPKAKVSRTPRLLGAQPIVCVRVCAGHHQGKGCLLYGVFPGRPGSWAPSRVCLCVMDTKREGGVYYQTYRCDLALHYFDRPTVPGMCAGVCCAGMCAGSWAVSVYSLDVLGCVLGCVLPAGCVLGCALGCVALRCERGAGLCRCTPSTCWDVCWGVLANMCAGCVLPPRAGAMRCDVSGVLGCVGVLPRCAGMCAGMCAASVRWDTCWAMCWDVGWVCWGVWAKMCVGMRAAPVCWDSCWDVCRAC